MNPYDVSPEFSRRPPVKSALLSPQLKAAMVVGFSGVVIWGIAFIYYTSEVRKNSLRALNQQNQILFYAMVLAGIAAVVTCRWYRLRLGRPVFGLLIACILGSPFFPATSMSSTTRLALITANPYYGVGYRTVGFGLFLFPSLGGILIANNGNAKMRCAWNESTDPSTAA